jgi:hypothetical protein
MFDESRANKVDLIILPESIPGTSCESCEHFDVDYCKHPKVEMNVSPRMCCYYWENPKAPRATEKDLDIHDPSSDQGKDGVGMYSSHEAISRFMRVMDDLEVDSEEIAELTRLSACGHTKDGEFDHKNTCWKLKKGGDHANHGRAQAHKEEIDRWAKTVDHLRKNSKDSSYSEIDSKMAEIGKLHTDIVKHIYLSVFGEKGAYRKDNKKKMIGHIRDLIIKSKTTAVRTDF